MGKLLTLILVLGCLSTSAQYQKRKKDKIKINTTILTIVGGTTFVAAGSIAMKGRGNTPFVNNGTKWKTCPSEWAIIAGLTVITIGITYKF